MRVTSATAMRATIVTTMKTTTPTMTATVTKEIAVKTGACANRESNWLRLTAGVILLLSTHLALAEPTEPTPFVRPEIQIAKPAKSSDDDKPFWRRSAERLMQIREERSIQVSSRREDLENGEMRFHIIGAGDIARSCEFSFEKAQEFERLPKITDHFDEVVSERARGQLFFIVSALGIKGRLLMNIEPVSASLSAPPAVVTPQRNSNAPVARVVQANPELAFEVVWGSFRGMKGTFEFDPIDSEKCEVSVIAEYQTAHPPLTKKLFGFALEVVIQKVAEQLRSFVERASYVQEGPYKERGETDPTKSLESILKREQVPLVLLRERPAHWNESAP